MAILPSLIPFDTTNPTSAASDTLVRMRNLVVIVVMTVIGCAEIIGLDDPLLGTGGNEGGGGAVSMGGAGGLGGGTGGDGGGGELNCDDCTGDVVWSRSFGTSGNNAGLHVIALDGDVVIAAQTDGDIAFGPSTFTDAATLARIDASGDVIWSGAFGGLNLESVQSLAPHPSGDIIVGGSFTTEILTPNGGPGLGGATDEDGFVVRIDGGTGSGAWIQAVRGNDAEVVMDVASAVDGRIAIIGNFETTLLLGGMVTPSQGATDIFVSEMQAFDGVPNNVFVIASPSAETGHGIAIDAAGRLIVTGDYATNLGIGTEILPNNSQLEVFLARMSFDGSDVDGAVALGGNNFQHARTLDVHDDRLLVGGGFQSELLFGGMFPVLAEYQAQQWLTVADLNDLTHVSTTAIAEVNNADRDERVVSAAFDSVGNIVMAGRLQGQLNLGPNSTTSEEGSRDMIVAKLSQDGTPIWSHTFGDASRDELNGIASDGEASYVVGTYSGEITLEQTHTCPATSCVLVARLAR